MAHILVVEDEAHIRSLIAKVMHTAGHTTTEAQNGLEALDMLDASAQTFNLILLDVRMPVLDGFEFLSEFKTRPYAPQIPVIVISAHWDKIPVALQEGANGQLTKPFSRENLTYIVNQFVNASVV